MNIMVMLFIIAFALHFLNIHSQTRRNTL